MLILHSLVVIPSKKDVLQHLTFENKKQCFQNLMKKVSINNNVFLIILTLQHPSYFQFETKVTKLCPVTL